MCNNQSFLIRLKIIVFILLILSNDSAVLLQRKIRCRLLLRLKELTRVLCVTTSSKTAPNKQKNKVRKGNNDAFMLSWFEFFGKKYSDK